eukprot:CAMPEP_0194325000 /NCGR_PEP_ID=MMETSP0171-20130528/28978_1 /TAXON_ID=218684 /ORGANISM="Corethron pennatum, Strain L29A3" /LENGTH=613 /DNA_ID=CAMNT_0039084007 /DNA_START=57 /DNA_END=1895 /DNA_ORIENTATION=+
MPPSQRIFTAPADGTNGRSGYDTFATSGSRTGYRGFSTSICSNFSKPSRRSDCCSLACCGILSSDRTRYLLLDQRPTWIKRLLLNLALPLGLLWAIAIISRDSAEEAAVAECKVAFPDDGSGPNLDAFNRKGSYYDRLVLWLIVALFIVIVVLLARASNFRFSFRRIFLSKLPPASARGTMPPASTRGTIRAARICDCYEAPDDSDEYLRSEPEDAAAADHDLCACLWSCLSRLCCLTCCSCWCQCCGMCAIGQEAREIDLIVPKERRRMDYVTFQPYAEYWPELERLRTSGEGAFFHHFRALSDLSSRIVGSGGAALLFAVVYSLAGIDRHFSLANAGVVFATLAQSFVILYFVHWRWHRFDVSLDAVVKCFASGFVLSTSTAFVVELLVSVVTSICPGLLRLFTFLFFEDMGIDSKQLDIGLGVISMFLNAFVVAALSEELCKYFAYWMVEHPDFLDDDEREELELAQSDERLPSPGRSPSSRGTGITVAMVAAALGFTCCENLEYVLASSDTGVQVATLIARSVLPVHALAAAIQSVGVCRRDLEGDRSHQLGRIVLPALLLHGFYDFFLMVMPVFVTANDDDDVNDEVSKYNGYISMCKSYGALDSTIW